MKSTSGLDLSFLHHHWIPDGTASVGNNYLRKGGYVIVTVCLSVCLPVSNFAQKLSNGFAKKFREG